MDPIRSTGVIKVEELKNGEQGSGRGTSALLDRLTQKEQEGWCGLKTQKGKPKAKKGKSGVWARTRSVEVEEIKQLEKEHPFINKFGQPTASKPVLKVIASRKDKAGNRMAAALFLVEKSGNRPSADSLLLQVDQREVRKTSAFPTTKSESYFQVHGGFPRPTFHLVGFQALFLSDTFTRGGKWPFLRCGGGRKTRRGGFRMVPQSFPDGFHMVALFRARHNEMR